MRITREILVKEVHLSISRKWLKVQKKDENWYPFNTMCQGLSIFFITTLLGGYDCFHYRDEELRIREVNSPAKGYAVTSDLDRSAWSRMSDCNVPALSCIPRFQKSERGRIMDGESEWHRSIVKIWKDMLDTMADRRQWRITFKGTVIGMRRF